MAKYGKGYRRSPEEIKRILRIMRLEILMAEDPVEQILQLKDLRTLETQTYGSPVTSLDNLMDLIK